MGDTCRIAAKQLTLTGGAYRVGVRMPGAVGDGRHLLDRGQAAMLTGVHYARRDPYYWVWEATAPEV